MQISNEKVGTIHYTLKDKEGQVIDSSEGQDPIAYIQGKGNLIAGMEKALEGKQAGDKFDVVIEPAEGYGERVDANVHKVPIANFPEKEKVKVGVQFQAQTPEGPRVATVINIEGDQVTVDFNHPLAGETLYFNIEVVGVREATADEISHGHVHGPSCNH